METGVRGSMSENILYETKQKETRKLRLYELYYHYSKKLGVYRTSWSELWWGYNIRGDTVYGHGLEFFWGLEEVLLNSSSCCCILSFHFCCTIYILCSVVSSTASYVEAFYTCSVLMNMVHLAFPKKKKVILSFR